MNKFINALKIDLTVASRNGIILITAIVAVAYILMVNFAIPEGLNLTFGGNIILDLSEGAKYKETFEQTSDKTSVFTDRASFDKEMANSSTMGIILYDDTFTVVKQGFESDKTVNRVRASVQFFLEGLKGQNDYKRIEVEAIREYPKSLSLRKMMIPILLASDIVLLGFLFGTTMIFQERKEKSITAYRVSPASALNYLMSKAVLNVIIALVFALVFAFFTLGFSINYLAYFILITIVSFLITFIGILLGQFFSSLSDFLYVMLGFMMLISMPVITYMNPNFRFPGIDLIPSYQMVFSMDAMMKPGWEWSMLGTPLLVLGVELILFGFLSLYVTKKHLLKEKG